MHFDFLTTQIDNELKEKLESKGAGLFEIPTLKNPRAQYKAICDIIKKNGYDTAYFNISTAICYPGPKAAHDCGVKRSSFIRTTRGMIVRIRKACAYDKAKQYLPQFSL